MASLVCFLLTLYLLVILARVVMSWFPVQQGGAGAQVTGFLYALTEPVLGPLRRALPPVPIGSVRLDLSPIIVFFGIQILQGVIC